MLTITGMLTILTARTSAIYENNIRKNYSLPCCNPTLHAGKFSVGFMSGELPRQGSSGIWFLWKNDVTDLAVWQGAVLC